MTTAGQVAIELRKLADALDKEPAAAIVRPYILFNTDDKEVFLALARMFPRPYDKSVDGEETQWPNRQIKYQNESIHAWATCPLAKTCVLVSPAIPAKYECEPLLSAEEEEVW